MVLERLIGRIQFTRGIPEVITLAAGLAKGFGDSKGFHGTKLIENSVIISPILLHTGLGGYFGLCEGIAEHERYTPFIVKEAGKGAFVGAVEVGIGYALGYTLGSLTN